MRNLLMKILKANKQIPLKGVVNNDILFNALSVIQTAHCAVVLSFLVYLYRSALLPVIRRVWGLYGVWLFLYILLAMVHNIGVVMLEVEI